MPLHHVPLVAGTMKSRCIFRLTVRTSIFPFVDVRRRAAAKFSLPAGGGLHRETCRAGHGRIESRGPGPSAPPLKVGRELLRHQFCFFAQKGEEERRGLADLLPKKGRSLLCFLEVSTSPQGPFTRSAPRPSHAVALPALAVALPALASHSPCAPCAARRAHIGASPSICRPGQTISMSLPHRQAWGMRRARLPPPCSVSAPQLRGAFAPAPPLLSARPLRAQRPPLNCMAPSRPPPHRSAPVPPLLSACPSRPSQAPKGPPSKLTSLGGGGGGGGV